MSELIHPVLSFKIIAEKKKINLRFMKNIYTGFFTNFNVSSRANIIFSKFLLKKLDTINVFTKKRNFNKLYIESGNGIFLSPGIVIRFTKQDQSKFLKKRLKTWYSFIKAMKMLQKNNYILRFKDLFGKKSLLLQKIYKSKIKVSIVLIKFFYINFSLHTKKSRRIKRWIKKKYYQIEINEKR